MMSARFGLRPVTSARSAGVLVQSHSSSASTSPVWTVVPCTVSVECPRRAIAIRAMLVKEPPEPMRVAWIQSRHGSAFRSTWRTCRRSAATSFCGSRLPGRCDSVSRTAPRGSEVVTSTRPSTAPISSSEPPPMSATSVRVSVSVKWWATERHERRASRSSSMISSGMSSSLRIRAAKAGPLLASRMAEVATAASRVTPRRSATPFIRRSASNACSIASGSRAPVVPTPRASRGIAFSSSMTSMPLDGSCSATSRRIELEPTSMAPSRSRPATGPLTWARRRDPRRGA